MLQVIYEIIGGDGPYIVSLTPSSLPDQTPAVAGIYSFDNVPVGDYVLSVTDSFGCHIVNNVTVVTPLEIVLTFSGISNADLMIGTSSSSLIGWNNFFNLPANGNSFTSIEVSGDTVRLIGGSNITMRTSLFDNDYSFSLLSIVDNGSIVSALDKVFGDSDNNICIHLTTAILPSLITMGDFCFYGCDSLVNINFSSLVTSGQYCFYFNTSIIDFNLPLLITAGNSCFYNCNGVLSYELPLLVSAGNSCFANNSSVEIFNLPSLLIASGGCFGNFNYDTSLITLNLPIVTYIGNNCFYNCNLLETIYMPNCINLGDSVYDNGVFSGLISYLSLTIPGILMTNNSGGPDGDIFYLSYHTTVEFNIIGDLSYELFIVSSDMTSIIGDMTLVSNWNMYFDLPVYGEPFTSVDVTFGDGNYNINLKGSSNITLKDDLFNASGQTINWFYDNIGCITSAGNNIFSDLSYGDSHYFYYIKLPNILSIGDNFLNGVYSMFSIILPLLSSAGNNCFTRCFTLKYIKLPSLISIGYGGFKHNSSLLNIELMNCLYIGDQCFYGDYHIKNLKLNSCTNLGSTTSNNDVFKLMDINEHPITTFTYPIIITIPSSLNSDGDIIYLNANSTLTIINI